MNAAADNSRRGDAEGRNRAGNLVYGVGKTGLSVARFLKRREAGAIYVDSRPEPPGLGELRVLDPDAEIALGQPSVSVLEGISRLIVSPGISDRDPLLVAARAAGIDVVSDIELFVDNATAPFVAVTGSNGKSTVTTLLARMCEAGGRRVLAGANLGEPALDLLEAPVPESYILELSSFQLQRTRYLPATVAVLLNVSADHLDWHRDEAEYRAAKLRIYREADAAVWNREEGDTLRWLRTAQPAVSFGLDEAGGDDFGIVVDGGERYLAKGARKLLAASGLALVGRHNQANALAALAAGELLGLDLDAMCAALSSFEGLPHRMQFVGRFGGAGYINDSKATNVAAAVASINAVETPVVLIAGGIGKGGNFRSMADAVSARLRAAVLIGADAAVIEDAFAGRVPTVRAGSMAEAVAAAAELARDGDTVLLAPACASLDQFESYGERGDAFRAAVEALAP